MYVLTLVTSTIQCHTISLPYYYRLKIRSLFNPSFPNMPVVLGRRFGLWYEGSSSKSTLFNSDLFLFEVLLDCNSFRFSVIRILNVIRSHHVITRVSPF